MAGVLSQSILEIPAYNALNYIIKRTLCIKKLYMHVKLFLKHLCIYTCIIYTKLIYIHTACIKIIKISEFIKYVFK